MARQAPLKDSLDIHLKRAMLGQDRDPGTESDQETWSDRMGLIGKCLADDKKSVQRAYDDPTIIGALKNLRDDIEPIIGSGDAKDIHGGRDCRRVGKLGEVQCVGDARPVEGAPVHPTAAMHGDH